MNSSVTLKKGLLGRYSLSYDCPRCKTRLTSRLDDAGNPDTCPDCGIGFTVPGVAERDRVHAEAATADRQADEMKELARQKRLTKPENKRIREDAAATQPEIGRQQRISTVELVDASPPQPFSRKCPYCAELILAEAKKCKHCGEFLRTSTLHINRPLNAPWYKPSKAAKYGIAFLLLCMFLIAINDTNRSSNGESNELSTTAELQMIKAAQRGVSRVLKAPSSAEFPSLTFNRGAYSIQEISSDTYQVTGYVDAENSFGAKLRNNWVATCIGSGMNWYASSATLLDP